LQNLSQIDNPEDCGQKFVSNRRVGLLLFLGIVAGNLLKDSAEDLLSAM
jgi:4-hydroxybenzoate polyprenyltransferase